MYIHAPTVQLSITSYGVPSSPVQLSFVLHRPSSVYDDVIVPLLAAVVKIWFPAIAKARRLLIKFVRLNYPWLKVFFWTFKTRSRSSERSWLFKCFKGLQMIPGIPVYWVVEKINYLEGPKKADKNFQRILHTRCLVCFDFCKRETNKHGDKRSSIHAN